MYSALQHGPSLIFGSTEGHNVHIFSVTTKLHTSTVRYIWTGRTLVGFETHFSVSRIKWNRIFRQKERDAYVLRTRAEWWFITYTLHYDFRSASFLFSPSRPTPWRFSHFLLHALLQFILNFIFVETARESSTQVHHPCLHILGVIRTRYWCDLQLNIIKSRIYFLTHIAIRLQNSSPGIA